MITVVIPAFNEENFLKKTVYNIVKASQDAGNVSLDIIIVNDGSTDRTHEIIQEVEQKFTFVRSIHHSKNTGLGSCIKEAIQLAKYPKFMFLPGDNDIPQNIIKNLFMLRDKASLVIVYILNREIRGRRRTLLSILFGSIYMIVFNIFVQYIQGPGLYSTKKLKKLNIKSNRFSITPEINLKMLRSGSTFYEIPGYIQTGKEGSTALTVRNLIEIVISFFRLFWEIYFHKRSFYNKKQNRIY